MKIHGIDLIEQDDMVIRHQQKTGRPFESQSIAAWQAACSQGLGWVYDIGAYTGLYSLVAAANAGVFALAFEPNPAVHSRLQDNIVLNGQQGRVSANRAAVCRQQGMVGLSTNPLVRLTSGGQVVQGNRVPAVTLDSIPTESPENFRLLAIKIDVEGGETDVLLGGQKTIAKHLPLIITEALSEAAAAQQEAVLAPLGYTAQRADEWNIIWRPGVH